MIEVEQATPLTGRIGDPRRGMTPFMGWIGLGSELERLLVEDSERERQDGEPPMG
jgi:hypothetical protein